MDPIIVQLNNIIGTITQDDILEFKHYKKLNGKYYSSYFVKVDEDINFTTREFSWFSTNINQSVLHLFDSSRREYGQDDLLQPRLYEVNFNYDDKYLINSTNVDNKFIFNGILSERIITELNKISPEFDFAGDNNKYILYILQQLHLKGFLTSVIGYKNDLDQNEIGILSNELEFSELSIFILDHINRVNIFQYLNNFFNINKHIYNDQYINKDNDDDPDNGRPIIDIIQEEIQEQQNITPTILISIILYWSKNIILNQKLGSIIKHYSLNSSTFSENYKIEFPLRYSNVTKQFFQKKPNGDYLCKYSTDYCEYNGATRSKCYIINLGIKNMIFKKYDSDETLTINFVKESGKTKTKEYTLPNKRAKKQKYMKYKIKYLKLKEQLKQIKI